MRTETKSEAEQIRFLHMDFPLEEASTKSYGITAAFAAPSETDTHIAVGFGFRSSLDNPNRKRGNMIARGRLDTRPVAISLIDENDTQMSVADALKRSIREGALSEQLEFMDEKTSRLPRWLPSVAELVAV